MDGIAIQRIDNRGHYTEWAWSTMQTPYAESTYTTMHINRPTNPDGTKRGYVSGNAYVSDTAHVSGNAALDLDGADD